MKILSINDVLNLNCKNRTFKGLEGYPKSTEIPSNSINQAYFDTKIPYYPFKNESHQEVENFVKENRYISKRDTVRDFDSGYSVLRTDFCSVDVRDRLPFDSELWKSYKKNKYRLSKANIELIENSLHKLNLRQYIKRNPIKYIIAKLIK